MLDTSLNLAFCPVDLGIPRMDLDFKGITSFFEKYSHLHKNKIWQCLPLLGRVASSDEFLRHEDFEKAWGERYAPKGMVRKNPLLPTAYNDLFHLMSLLPFKLLTHAQILKQVKPVPAHLDFKYEDGSFIDDTMGFHREMEPCLYKILLNDKLEPRTFFVAPEAQGPKHYVNLPDETNVFCISESTFWHGSDVPSAPKYIVSVFGLIDRSEHAQVLERSLKRFGNEGVFFHESLHT